MRRLLKALCLSLLVLPLGLPAAAKQQETAPSLRVFMEKFYAPDTAPEPLEYSHAKLPGSDVIIVYINSSDFCGSGGCVTLFVREAADGSVSLINRATIVQLPIGYLETRSNNVPDIVVDVAGGGIEPHSVVMAYNGKRFPGNPTVPPATALTGGKVTVLIDWNTPTEKIGGK